MMDEFEMSLRIAELEDELEKMRNPLTTMTKIDCAYCRGTFIVDLGYAPIRPKRPGTYDFAIVHCPYCTKDTWCRI